MKTTLLSFLFTGITIFSFAQAPCPVSIAGGTNVGAGDCKECAGTPNNSLFDFSQAATAKVVVKFTEALPCIPRLINITNEAGITLNADCGIGTIKQGGGPSSTLVEYCFWGNDAFFKAKNFLSVRLQYECNGITRTCFLDGNENIPLPVQFKSFNASRTTSSTATACATW